LDEAIPQMELGLEIPEVAALHRSWDLDVARERENRTRFAQRALKPPMPSWATPMLSGCLS
jgi:hypothetical protein